MLGLVVLWLVLSRGIEGQDATWERVVETGVLVVCTDPSWPPFEFVDEATGQIEGFDIALAREMAARLAPGVRARIVSVGFDGLYDALLAGRCDAVLSALPYEPLRTQDVTYSVAYFNAGIVIAVPHGTREVAELQDLEGHVVGVEWGFVPEGNAREREFLRTLGPRRYNTAGDALRALDAGEVEAALVDRISALAYARECGGIEMVGEPLHDLNYVVPVRPDSFRLLSEINRVLLEMRKDGSLDRLLDTWF
ncbi:MAG: amino acid ABC transporter substrate-binding protein [Anaerolineae bacterium]|nr:amino acid ABC transporter substrate-binding protein [Anaerolineae bacterium]